MVIRRYGFIARLSAALIVGLAGVPSQVVAHPTIDVVASNWKFMPNTITIEVGQPATLRLTSTSGVHGIESPELGIKKTTITPNAFAVITFTPTKAGKYKLQCAVMCGPGHADMVLTIVVK